MHNLSAPWEGALHRHGSNQPVDLSTSVGWRARSTQPLERGASTTILSVD
jgi:hypothetical protein